MATGTPIAESQRRKLRQAAFAYIHVAVLYESAVFVMARRGLLGARLGSPMFWLVMGAIVVALVFWALWVKESVMTARVIWALGLFRIPTLIASAFFPLPTAKAPAAFFVAALLVVVINAWMLARAGWDL